jgi:signal transduction histidine kinase
LPAIPWSVFDFAIGGLEVVLAVTLFLNLWRSGDSRRYLRWFAVFIAFFGLRAIERIAVEGFGSEPAQLGRLLDIGLVVVLFMLIFATKKIFHAADSMWDSARIQKREYDRALADYRRLARHRLVNPLTAIEGSARALRDLSSIDERTRRELLKTIVDETSRLTTVILEPGAPLAKEERHLRPEPDLEKLTPRP